MFQIATRPAAYSCCCLAREGFVPKCYVGAFSEGVILGIVGLVHVPKVVDKVSVDSDSHGISTS